MRRGSFARLARLAFAGAVLTVPVAQAQQVDDGAAGSSTPVSSACAPVPTETADDPTRVDALFQRFQCLFEAQQYQACLPVLEQACKLTDSARCLFNLALVHHALLHCETALGYYEAYLERDPYDAGREEALSALADLQSACGKHEPAPLLPPATVAGILPLAGEPGGAASAQSPSVAPTPAAPARDGTSTRRVLAFSTLGAGAATAIATVVFAVAGQRSESDVAARARPNNGALDPSDREARSLDDSGHRYNTLAWVFLGSSAALLGTSVTLFVLDAQATQSVSVSTEGFTSVRYQGRF